MHVFTIFTFVSETWYLIHSWNDALAASVFLSTSIDGESRRFDTCPGHPAVKNPSPDLRVDLHALWCLHCCVPWRCVFSNHQGFGSLVKAQIHPLFHLQVATSLLLRLVITIHTELHFFEVLSEFIPCTISGTQCMVHCLCIAQNNYHVL